MTLPNFPNNPTLGQTFNVGNATYECTKVVSGSAKAEWRVVGQADKGLRAALGAVDSTVPIAGIPAYLIFPISLAGSPTGNLIPTYIGQECLDTLNSKWYKAKGLTIADWLVLN